MLYEVITRSVDKFVVDDSKFSLIYFSLDGLSYVNDKYGYEVGDDVIISCANRLRNSFKKSDFVGRLGNGFIVIVEGANNAEEVANIANVASLYMEQPIDASSVRITSYNVCYTKLLRIPVFIINIRHPLQREIY